LERFDQDEHCGESDVDGKFLAIFTQRRADAVEALELIDDLPDAGTAMV